jgi:RNA polymerase-binding transcription factor DksA
LSKTAAGVTYNPRQPPRKEHFRMSSVQQPPPPISAEQAETMIEQYEQWIRLSERMLTTARDETTRQIHRRDIAHYRKLIADIKAGLPQ